MYPYEAEALSRAIIADRIREADHRRLVRGTGRSEPRSKGGSPTESAGRRSRLWRLVHLSHSYG